MQCLFPLSPCIVPVNLLEDLIRCQVLQLEMTRYGLPYANIVRCTHPTWDCQSSVGFILRGRSVVDPDQTGTASFGRIRIRPERHLLGGSGSDRIGIIWLGPIRLDRHHLAGSGSASSAFQSGSVSISIKCKAKLYFFPENLIYRPKYF